MKSYSIGKRLALAMTAVLVLTLLLGGSYLFAIRSMDASFDRTADVTMRKVQLGAELDAIKSDMYLAQRGFVLGAFLGDSARMEDERTQFQNKTALFRQELEEVRPLLVTAEDQALVVSMRQKSDDWMREFTEVDRFVNAGDPYSAQKHSFAKIKPIYNDPGGRPVRRCGEGYPRTRPRAGERRIRQKYLDRRDPVVAHDWLRGVRIRDDARS